MKIAVLGARGLIGRQFLRVLEEAGPIFDVDCFGSSENEVTFNNSIIYTKLLDIFNPDGYDLIFTALDSKHVELLKEKIAASGVLWIDKSTAMRMDENVPLIIPEINLSAIEGKKIIASPNCVVIPVAMFLHCLKVYECVNIATYQSISGAGQDALAAFFKEMKASNIQTLTGGLFYEHPMAFNVIPCIGEIDEDGHCVEEVRITQELHKILQRKFSISVTVMRVPVTIGHTVALNCTLTQGITKEQIIKAMRNVGIVYSDKVVTPLMAAKEDVVYACRLRVHDNMCSVVLVCDNLRKGGALNAWQIAKARLVL